MEYKIDDLKIDTIQKIETQTEKLLYWIYEVLYIYSVSMQKMKIVQMSFCFPILE